MKDKSSSRIFVILYVGLATTQTEVCFVTPIHSLPRASLQRLKVALLLFLFVVTAL